MQARVAPANAIPAKRPDLTSGANCGGRTFKCHLPLLAKRMRFPRLFESHSLERRRQQDFEPLAIVRISEQRVSDPRGLETTTPLPHDDLALAFEFVLGPPLEAIQHLKGDLVKVTPGHIFGAEWGNEPHDVRPHHPAGRGNHSKIAIFRIVAQTAGDEGAFAMMSDRERLRRPSRP